MGDALLLRGLDPAADAEFERLREDVKFDLRVFDLLLLLLLLLLSEDEASLLGEPIFELLLVALRDASVAEFDEEDADDA